MTVKKPLDTVPHVAGHPLEATGAGLKAMLKLVGDRLAEHVDSLEQQPAHQPKGGRKLALQLVETEMPEQGTALAPLLRHVMGRAAPLGIHTEHPGYMGYIPGGGILSAAVADVLALSLNRYVGIWQGSPGLVQLESNVLQWMCRMAGFPSPDAGGVFTTGGSMSNLLAIHTARVDRLGQGRVDGVIYVSPDTHHSVLKAALVTGFPASCVRTVPVDAQRRMRVDLLASLVAEDVAAGRHPFLVVASAGTTATGAVDPLEDVAAVCGRHQLWLHVDAAFGGFFLLTERGRTALSGIQLAHSITLDAHKSLFLPYGTGTLLVRDVAALRQAHTVHANYLPHSELDGVREDFSDLSFELSREARGLRVWLPLKLHGAAAFRDALDEKLDVASRARAQLAAIPGVRLPWDTALPLLAFTVHNAADEDVTAQVLKHVNAAGDVLLSATRLDGQDVARMCILNFRTHARHVDAAVERIAHAVQETLRTF